jgi:hypothetical protein
VEVEKMRFISHAARSMAVLVGAVGMFCATGSRALAAGGLAADSASHHDVHGASLASEATANTNLVTPGDPFNIAITGFNGAGGALLTPAFTVNFGTSPTFTNATIGGGSVTITSSETQVAGLYTGTVTIDASDTFIPAGTTIGGAPITSVFVEIGQNAGANGINFTAPVNTATWVDSFTVRASGAPVFSGDFNQIFGAGNAEVEGYGGVGAGGADLGGFDIDGFTVTFTYRLVPEPTTAGLLGLGLLGAGRRLRRVR